MRDCNFTAHHNATEHSHANIHNQKNEKEGEEEEEDEEEEEEQQQEKEEDNKEEDEEDNKEEEEGTHSTKPHDLKIFLIFFFGFFFCRESRQCPAVRSVERNNKEEQIESLWCFLCGFGVGFIYSDLCLESIFIFF